MAAGRPTFAPNARNKIMIMFLYGPDTYRLRRKLSEIVEYYKKSHKSGLNLIMLNLARENFGDFKSKIETTSMFKEKKLIILENAINNREFAENFLKYKKDFGDSVILFFEEGVIDARNALFKFLKKSSKCQEFDLLDGQKLKNWVRKEFFNFQTEIAPEALDELLDFVGSDLWQMSNEIKKLINFKGGKRIEKKDVDLLVRPKIETDIFKTIDAIALKDRRQALKLIHKHLGKGDNPSYLLSMINFQFRNLLTIRDLIDRGKPFYLFSGITKLHPYIIKKSYSQAQKFSLSELKKIYRKIFQIDLDVKRGRTDLQTAIDLLITEI